MMSISLLISNEEIQGLPIQKVKPFVFTKGNILLFSPCHRVVRNTSFLLHSICLHPTRARRKSQSLSRTWLCCFSDLIVAPVFLTSLVLRN